MAENDPARQRAGATRPAAPAKPNDADAVAAPAAPAAPVAPAARLLHDLDFIDVYLRVDQPAPPRFHPMPGKGFPEGNLPVPEEFQSSLEKLRRKLATIERPDFSVFHEGVVLRASCLALANGERWVALRRISGGVPKLEALNLGRTVVPILRGFGTRSGLILIAGGTGNGKTTTAVALLGDWLNRLGQTALTLEDPIEYPLQGEHGEAGYCFQVEVEKDSEWASGLHTGLRWHPRYILVGEIRTPGAAAQVLRAANSGHLVLTTVHAGSIEAALSNLMQLAGQEIGDRARHLLAEGLIVALHQRLTGVGPVVRLVATDADSQQDPVRIAIRDDRLEALAGQIEAQTRRLQEPAAMGGARR